MKRSGLHLGMSGCQISATGVDALIMEIRNEICGSRVKALSKNHLNNMAHGFGQHRQGHQRAM